ncbi:MAG: hypothetical protein DMG65_25440 [Candidatus Angelobacter sp. Gp1-AA117]|nr:MAG: hypothetical protein DMG65_25440 [Candidatus Angelobacter sp. Gp1-AA117]
MIHENALANTSFRFFGLNFGHDFMQIHSGLASGPDALDFCGGGLPMSTYKAEMEKGSGHHPKTLTATQQSRKPNLTTNDTRG